MEWWCLAFECDGKDVETAEEFLEGIATVVSVHDPEAERLNPRELLAGVTLPHEALSEHIRQSRRHWQIEAYFGSDTKPGDVVAALKAWCRARGTAIGEASILRPEDRPAPSPSPAAAGPVAAGAIVVRPANDAAPPGERAITIDNAGVFGTGRHPTTYGCLVLIDRLAKRRRFERALDVGTGSGILALAIAQRMKIPVIASDLDPMAAPVVRSNARRNALHTWVTATTAPGLSHQLIRRGRPYDLITANILARPLASLAPAIARHLAPGGIVLLSGLLTDQEPMVFSRYRMMGLILGDRVVSGDWATLALWRPGESC